jgi:hypothetical protein
MSDVGFRLRWLIDVAPLAGVLRIFDISQQAARGYNCCTNTLL